MKLSFLIVNWNGGKVFENCIESINTEAANVLSKNEYEIIIIDNNSSEFNEAFFNDFKTVKIYRNQTNELFSIGTNQSVFHSTGEFLFFLNNDVLLNKGCLLPLLKEIEKENIDAAVPKLINMDGTIQMSIRSLPTIANIWFATLGLSYIHPKFDSWRIRQFDYNKYQCVEQPMFSAVIMKRETWMKVGELDINLPLLFNDVDWFKRFKDFGLKCYLIPTSQMYHVHGMSVNKSFVRKVIQSSKSMYYYFIKHSRNRTLFDKFYIMFTVGFTFTVRILFESLKFLIGYIQKKGNEK